MTRANESTLMVVLSWVCWFLMGCVLGYIVREAVLRG